jgi:hypothetical protein
MNPSDCDRMAPPDQVPRLARPFVVVLIVAMFACAIFAWEPWPLTSFRLFSNLRVDHQAAWSATTIDAGGNEEQYPLGGEDHGFRGFPFTMSEFVSADRGRQDQLCRTWVAGAPDLVGHEAVEVRLYLRDWTLSDRAGDHALPGATELRYTCTDGGLANASH